MSALLSPTSFSYASVTAPGKRDTRVVEGTRAPVEHQHMFPRAYKIIWPIFFTFMMFGRAIGLFVVSYIVFCWVFNLTILIPAVLGLYFAYIGYSNLVHNVMKREVGHEFDADRPIIRDLPEFKDPALIWRLWSASPYRASLLHHAVAGGKITADAARAALTAARTAAAADSATSVSAVSPAGEVATAPVAVWDRPEEATFYQPVEGYCATATINTMLYSVPDAGIHATRRMPRPATLAQLKTWIHEAAPLLPAAVTLRSVEAYEVDGAAVGFDAFCELVTRANQPNTRVLANFLRQPLFGQMPSTLLGRARALIGGHWTPIISVLDTPAVALLSDVNADYGPFVVPLRRLYDACRTKDGSLFRGLIVVQFDGNADAFA